MYKSKKRHKKHHLRQGKEIILFINQRLKLTILAGRRSPNLVQAPLNNAPSAPSISLFSQSTNHLKGKWMYLMEEKGLEWECWGNNSQKVANAWARKGREIGHRFIVIMIGCGMRPQDLLLYEKIWLFGWGTCYNRWIGWETSNSP